MVTIMELPPYQAKDPSIESPPRLENGDRLTRAEFEHRYHTMPDIKKAELIEGVVYMPSPVRSTHARCHSAMIGWLFAYCAATPGLDIGDNATVRLDADNEVQPDVLLRLDDLHDGSSHIADDDYYEGPPELIVEIAVSSVSYDLHDKLHVYRRTGVQEYIIWRVHENVIDWLFLQDGIYYRLEQEDGIVASKVFPGLTLNIDAITSGDLATVLATQQEALNSDAHKSFVQTLQSKPT